MQAVVLVLLLGVSLCGVHGSEEQVTPVLISTVKTLLGQVHTLEALVQSLQTKVRTLENEDQILHTKIQTLENQDPSLHTKVQTLENQDRSLQTEVQSLQTKLQTLENQDQSLQTEVQSLQTKVQTLENQDQSLQTKLQILDTSVAQQLNQQVAFFACLYNLTEFGNYGPFDIRTTIKYKYVLTNVGNGYNTSTGVFTAPLRGLYVFHFTMYTGSSPQPYALASLRKNNVILGYVDDRSKSDGYDYATRVAVVTLEPGDRVYVELDDQSYFYGYLGRHNSFSGFLLSPM